MPFGSLFIIQALVHLPIGLAALLHARKTLNLDGQWSFSLSDPAMQGAITVPGAWEAQGFGADSDTMRWQARNLEKPGKPGAVGVYSKKILSPCASEERVVLAVDGWIHRHAVFKANGDVIGEHRNYMTPFEADITSQMQDGEVDLEITVDGGRDPNVDPLVGESDLDTPFGESIGGWAGINGHIALECRPSVFIDLGIGSVMPPQISHESVNFTSEGAPLDINVTFSVSGLTHKMCAAVAIEQAGSAHPSSAGQRRSFRKMGSGSSGIPISSSGSHIARVRIPSVELWSVERPMLYNATITLQDESCTGPIIDMASFKFGVRTLQIDEYRILLNGRRIFLNGYGDDSIFPITVAPPRDQKTYAEMLVAVRSLGFNFVRHHSTTLPVEFFDAADEAGLLVSPEMPCAYPAVYTGLSKQALEPYNVSWTSRIRQLRNHPSIFVWSECNEATLPEPLLTSLYKTATELDPARFVLEIDGGYSKRGFYESRQFPLRGGGAWGVFEKLGANQYWDKCDVNGTCSMNVIPFRPIISHETGNYAGFPRFSSLFEKFTSSNTTIKPFWLTEPWERIKGYGLSSEADLWAAASEALYTTCWKMDIEDLRHNEQLSGYQWWLLVDFWRGTNGIFDVFGDPKPGISLDAIRGFNAPSVLLQSGFKLSYSGGDKMHVIISLSNYGLSDLQVGTLDVVLKMHNGSATVLTTQSLPISQPGVNQGGLGVVGTIDFTLPDHGTTLHPDALPYQVELIAALHADGHDIPVNRWNTTVLPRWVDTPTPATWTLFVTDPSLMNGCSYNNCQLAPVGSMVSELYEGLELLASSAYQKVQTAMDLLEDGMKHVFQDGLDSAPAVKSPQKTYSSPLQAGDAKLQEQGLWKNGVYLSKVASEPLLSAVMNGSVAVIIPEATGFFPSDKTSFKQAWWTGGAGPADNNAGVIVYPAAEEILGKMTAAGFPDQSWYRLIDGSQTFLMEDVFPLDPTSGGKIEVLIRAIDRFAVSRNKALLFKMKVGKGTLLVCGLNVYQDTTTPSSPEKSWVLSRLLAHAGELYTRRNSEASPDVVIV